MNTSEPRKYVEQFHLLFLDQLGRRVKRECLALKGGSNLRFFLKSIRSSEDMDLDIQNIGKDILQDKVNEILDSKPFHQILQVRRIRITRHSAPKQTDTTQRWKFGLQVPESALEMPTRIEFSRRGFDEGVKVEVIDPELIGAYGLAPIMAAHYVSEIAYRQKVHALLSRRTTQSRDVFDLHLLICSGAKTNLPPALKGRVEEAKERAMSIPFATFKSQVLAYLPIDYRAHYDSPSTWDDMVLKVVETLQEGAR